MKRLACAMLLALGCAETLPPVATADVTRAQSAWPKTTLADLERGRDLYRSRCTECHSLYSPGTYAPDRWPKLVKEMTDKARLDEAETRDVTRYLTIASANYRGATR
jgi:cytochrome c5